MRNEITYSLDMAAADPSVRCIIITGDTKGNAFCAGADLGGGDSVGLGADSQDHMPGDMPEGRPNNVQYWRDGGGTAGLAILRCTKPVIAAVNGAAVGVGMTELR